MILRCLYHPWWSLDQTPGLDPAPNQSNPPAEGVAYVAVVPCTLCAEDRRVEESRLIGELRARIEELEQRERQGNPHRFCDLEGCPCPCEACTPAVVGVA